MFVYLCIYACIHYTYIYFFSRLIYLSICIFRNLFILKFLSPCVNEVSGCNIYLKHDCVTGENYTEANNSQMYMNAFSCSPSYHVVAVKLIFCWLLPKFTAKLSWKNTLKNGFEQEFIGRALMECGWSARNL